MTQIINNKIQHRFSASAGGYDRASSLHRGIADRLWAKVPGGLKPSAVLDVGCGTGYLTRKARECFPESRVIGLDFAQGMLEVARVRHEGVTWVLGDAVNLPFGDGCFDLVISNLAYQWTGSVSRGFSEVRRVLAPNGILACTLFGYNTCQELFQSLDEAKSKALQFARLPNEARIRAALAESGFTDREVHHERVQAGFKDMVELMKWLKSIGANNLAREGFLGPETLSRAAAIYRDKFPCPEGVVATFEVIWVYGKK